MRLSDRRVELERAKSALIDAAACLNEPSEHNVAVALLLAGTAVIHIAKGDPEERSRDLAEKWLKAYIEKRAAETSDGPPHCDRTE